MQREAFDAWGKRVGDARSGGTKPLVDGAARRGEMIHIFSSFFYGKLDQAVATDSDVS